MYFIVDQYNLSPHKSLQNNSPLDIYYGKKISEVSRILKSLKHASVVNSILQRGT